MTSRRGAVARLGSLVLLLGAREIAWGASIVAVRVWPADDYTRVTIESDVPLAEKHFLVPDPHRLVIDVDNLELDATLRELVAKVKPDDPYIAGVRVGQNRPKVVRIVLDLKQPVAPQVFTLEPVAAYQHRLVLDLKPLREPDPLLALLDEKSRAPAAGDTPAADRPAADKPVPDGAAKDAAKDVRDSLGEFIGGTGRPVPAAPAGASAPRGKSRIDRLVIVAIDPGHGGEDPGAVGPTGLREKDVVLAVALQLRDRINARPGMRAMLTRDGDFFVPLQDRVRKARRVQADLFVSIHADAFVNRDARGASVFALSERGASSSAARWMAERENASDGVGGVNVRSRDQGVLRTLLDMSTAAQIKDSLKLGSEVLGQIGKVGRLHKPRVEQAGFAVLKAPDVPSILVETAFISNPDEERKLRDPDYREKLVEALDGGIARYFARNPPLARNRQI